MLIKHSFPLFSLITFIASFTSFAHAAPITSPITSPCYFDFFTPEKITAEVSALENSHPDAVSTYLQKFGGHTDASLANQDCKDLRCLFKSLRAPDGLALWYYKMGYGYELTAWSGIQGMDINAHTFKQSEVRGMAMLTELLPNFFRNMSTLGLFRRTPDDFIFDDDTIGEYRDSPHTPDGLAVITITDIASSASHEGRIDNPFFLTLVHEMAHAFDREILNDQGAFSYTTEWMNLSHWKFLGRGHWETTSTNFVTPYASTHPAEDFAESMAYFILFPELLKANAPDKFEFLAQRFYEGKKFDNETLKKNYFLEMKKAYDEESVTEKKRAAVNEKIKELRASDYYACEVLNKLGQAELIRKVTGSYDPR